MSTKTSTATIANASIKHLKNVETGDKDESSWEGAYIPKKLACNTNTNSIETIRNNSIFESLTLFFID
jgi:hypothetical protein